MAPNMFKGTRQTGRRSSTLTQILLLAKPFWVCSFDHWCWHKSPAKEWGRTWMPKAFMFSSASSVFFGQSRNSRDIWQRGNKVRHVERRKRKHHAGRRWGTDWGRCGVRASQAAAGYGSRKKGLSVLGIHWLRVGITRKDWNPFTIIHVFIETIHLRPQLLFGLSQLCSKSLDLWQSQRQRCPSSYTKKPPRALAKIWEWGRWETFLGF